MTILNKTSQKFSQEMNTGKSTVMNITAKDYIFNSPLFHLMGKHPRLYSFLNPMEKENGDIDIPALVPAGDVQGNGDANEDVHVDEELKQDAEIDIENEFEDAIDSENENDENEQERRNNELHQAMAKEMLISDKENEVNRNKKLGKPGNEKVPIDAENARESERYEGVANWLDNRGLPLDFLHTLSKSLLEEIYSIFHNYESLGEPRLKSVGYENEISELIPDEWLHHHQNFTNLRIVLHHLYTKYGIHYKHIKGKYQQNKGYFNHLTNIDRNKLIQTLNNYKIKSSKELNNTRDEHLQQIHNLIVKIRNDDSFKQQLIQKHQLSSNASMTEIVKQIILSDRQKGVSPQLVGQDNNGNSISLQ